MRGGTGAVCGVLEIICLVSFITHRGRKREGECAAAPVLCANILLHTHARTHARTHAHTHTHNPPGARVHALARKKACNNNNNNNDNNNNNNNNNNNTNNNNTTSLDPPCARVHALVPARRVRMRVLQEGLLMMMMMMMMMMMIHSGKKTADAALRRGWRGVGRWETLYHGPGKVRVITHEGFHHARGISSRARGRAVEDLVW